MWENYCNREGGYCGRKNTVTIRSMSTSRVRQKRCFFYGGGVNKATENQVWGSGMKRWCYGLADERMLYHKATLRRGTGTGCFIKPPQSGRLVLNGNLFLTVPETGISGCQYDQILVSISSGLETSYFLLYLMGQTAERGSKLSADSYKGTDPIHEVFTLMTSSPKGPTF